MSYFWPQNRPLLTKKNAITQDYDVSQKSLGVGINGKVLECYRKKDKGKFALKVRLNSSYLFLYNFKDEILLALCIGVLYVCMLPEKINNYVVFSLL